MFGIGFAKGYGLGLSPDIAIGSECAYQKVPHRR